jgi:glycerol-3-phosphate dehydrogenase
VDDVAGLILSRPVAQPQQWSVALNFVTSRPAPQVAFTVAAGAGDPDRMFRSAGRQVFVVPWRGQTMFGTAHLPYRGAAADFELRDDYVDEFLAELANSSPRLDLSRDEIRLVHHGLLPAAGGSAVPASGVRLLKRHRVVDHAADGAAGVLSVVSVKFTTAGVAAREVAERIGLAAEAGRGAEAGVAPPPLPGAAFESLDVLRSDAAARFGALLPADVLEHLVRSYGARYADVLAYRDRLDGWDRRIVPGAPVIRAQLLHGAVAELARTADDLLWRRTEIGPRGLITEAASREAGRVLEIANAGAGGGAVEPVG